MTSHNGQNETIETLQHLVAQAVALGGGNLCEAGHDWQSEGGRAGCEDCPRRLELEWLEELGVASHEEPPGQAVYRCARCGMWDFGEPGGPGHADCVRYCRRPV
jgi:hypothetical protein